ncbi:MAG: hypothetical protein MUC68_10960 [Burkholderiaceae bacterium]|nr:hypothetical protein [Burkholderiaceae bacterium]
MPLLVLLLVLLLMGSAVDATAGLRSSAGAAVAHACIEYAAVVYVADVTGRAMIDALACASVAVRVGPVRVGRSASVVPRRSLRISRPRGAQAHESRLDAPQDRPAAPRTMRGHRGARADPLRA